MPSDCVMQQVCYGKNKDSITQQKINISEGTGIQMLFEAIKLSREITVVYCTKQHLENFRYTVTVTCSISSAVLRTGRKNEQDSQK